MKKIDNWANIKESGDFKRIPEGGYIAQILDVQNNEVKEYLKISFDIAEGEQKGFFANEYKSDLRTDKKWPNAGSFVRSYKQSAAGMFKSFIGVIERSNSGYSWDWQEQTLNGKKCGLVVAYEEYVTQKGAVRTRPYVAAVRSVDAIKKGDFTVPALKKLDATKVAATTAPAPSATFVNPFDNDATDPFASTESAPTAAPATDDLNPWGDDSNPFAD